MGDLVERLQRLGKDSVGNYGMPIAAEAANEIESLRSALAKSASREAALVEALKLSEAVLAATQEVYGACLGPKTHEGINAALAKIKETTC